MSDEICSFCQRPGPVRGHHVVPRCKGGKVTAPTCRSCEDFIHKTWTHNQLRDDFNTVEKILVTEQYQRFKAWLLKQQDTTYFRTTRNSSRSAVRYR